MTRRAATLLAVFSLLATAAAARSLEHRDFDLDGFDSLRIDGVADVKLAVGTSHRVSLEASADIIDRVVVRVSGKTLVLDLEDDTDTDGADIRFEIGMPRLRALEVRGVADIVGSGLSEDELSVDVRGVIDVNLEGTVDRLDVDVKGVGDVDLSGLDATDANVRVRGVGNVEVRASGRVEANVGGVGGVRVHGDPKELVETGSAFGHVTRVR